MKCDLSGHDMMRLTVNGQAGYSCIFFEASQAYNCTAVLVDEQDKPIAYIYNSHHYTPDEWQRVLKLKAFL
jgi:hypothetical protein